MINTIVILAGGKGKRMFSDLPKVLCKLKNKFLISYVIETAEKINPEKIIAVVGFKSDLVKKELANYKINYAMQTEQLGTAHALRQAESIIGNKEQNIIVLLGDMPFISQQTLNILIEEHEKTNADATILTALFENPFGYGRIIRDQKGDIKSIIEERDASEKIKEIREINSGIYIFKSPQIFKIIEKIKNNNNSNEYYLTDAISLLIKAGKKVQAVQARNSKEVYGINTSEQLAQAEKTLKSSF